MNIKFRILTFLLITGLLSFAFTNCSEIETIKEQRASNQDSLIAEPDLGKAAMNILKVRCQNCHHSAQGNVGGFVGIDDYDGLIEQNQIIPGDAENSPIYQSLVASNGVSLMPIGGALDSSEIEQIKSWIDAGAEAPKSEEVIPLEASYFSIKANIIDPKCIDCHNSQTSQGSVDLSSYSRVMNYVDTDDPQDSELYLSTLDGSMPPEPQHPLSNEELTVILQWISNGAPE